MLRIIFIILMMLHGIIHILGFVKSINPEKVTQLTQSISKPFGLMWLLVTVLFLVTSLLYLFRNDLWIPVGVISLIISQILVIYFWSDAKYGTIPNIIILIVAGLSWGAYNFECYFQNDVKDNLTRTNAIKKELLTEQDINLLPIPVQKYLHYVGAINQPKVKNFRIVFEGEMRDKGKDYFQFVSEQYNFFDEPTRLFFMKGKMFGLEVPGYHKYINAKASMNIKLFGLISVIKKDGDVMDKTETVTLFNDMCLLAPPTLIDKRIRWETIDSTKVKAYFTNKGITISAILYFDNEGKLVDFVSNDRTSISEMKEYPFSTPVYEYRDSGSRKVLSKGDAVWHYPDGKFVYGKFNLKEIEYNVDNYKRH